MKRSLKSFTGFSLGVTDGKIREVEELYLMTIAGQSVI